MSKVGAAEVEHRAWTMSAGASGQLERRPAVSLAIAKRKGANAVTVAADVMRRLETIKGRDRSRGPRNRRHAQLWRNREREGQRASVPSGPRHGVDRDPHHGDDRLARGRGRSDHYSHHHPSDAVCLLDDGLHDQSRQPVRPHLLHRHSRRRRDRRRREHRSALVDARRTRACRHRRRGRRRGRQSDHRRHARDCCGAAADDVRQRPDGPIHEPDSGERLDGDAVLVLRGGDGDALAAAADRGTAVRIDAGGRGSARTRHRRDGPLLYPHRDAAAQGPAEVEDLSHCRRRGDAGGLRALLRPRTWWSSSCRSTTSRRSRFSSICPTARPSKTPTAS